AFRGTFPGFLFFLGALSRAGFRSFPPAGACFCARAAAGRSLGRTPSFSREGKDEGDAAVQFAVRRMVGVDGSCCDRTERGPMGMGCMRKFLHPPSPRWLIGPVSIVPYSGATVSLHR